MRKIITWVATTLDGYMEGPNGEGDLGWLMPYVEESLPDNSAMLGTEIDTILLGRVTYQGFSQYWPFQQGEFADLMNTTSRRRCGTSRARTARTWSSSPAAALSPASSDQVCSTNCASSSARSCSA